MWRLPLTNQPRESLFDALNVAQRPGLTIRMKQEGMPIYTGARLVVDVDGITVATLTDGKSYEMDNTEFLLGVLDMDDYQAYVKVIGVDDSVLYDGAITGTPIEITEYVKEIVLYKFVYDVTTVGTDFEVAILPIGGIFRTLRGMTNKSYFTDLMDVDYLTASSGSKAVSNEVVIYLAKYGEDVADAPVKVLSSAGIYALARTIWERYGDSWQHIYDALVAEYVPLENYSMHEETVPDLTDSFGVSDGYQKNIHRSVSSDATTESGVYGFNSATAVPANTENTSGSPLNNYEDETETQIGERQEKHTGKNTVDRTGNIGTVTAQQMLTEEIIVRINHHMDEIIYADVDKVLTTAGFAPILSKTINII